MANYPTHKPTIHTWLPQIPHHWKLRRGKSFLKPIDIRSTTGAEELLTVSSTHGVIPRASANVTMFQAQDYAGHKLCWPGDLVINSLWAWAQGLGISNTHGIVSPAYGVYRPYEPSLTNPRFLHYLTRSTPFQWELQVRSKGIWTSRLQLTDEAFLDIPFPIPPIREQDAIVHYLDRADELISRYISAKEQLIALLEEQRQVVIHQAVTRGIDTNVPLKQSSIPWLPKIPIHWDITRAKTLFHKQTRPVRPEDKIITCFRDGVVTLRENRRTEGFTQSILEIGYQGIRAGDLVIHNMDASAGAVGVSDSDGKATPVYSVCTVAPEANAFFYASTLREMARNQWINALATGIRERSTGFTYLTLALQYLPLPPLTDQHAIADNINLQTSTFTTEITRTHRQIDLMNEYRTRLIADVVTGRIDVRDAVVELPD